MITRLINDINAALDAEAYISALALALTLPDTCGKAEYPDLKTKERYLKWYEEYIGQHERYPVEEGEIENPYLSAEVVYQLRCNLLHQGTIDVEKEKIEEECCQIDNFILITESAKSPAIYPDASSVLISENEISRGYRVNVRRLCFLLTRMATVYYEKNKDKFTFLKINILNWDEEIKKMYAIRK